MTSSPHGLYAQHYTRATMGATAGCQAARWSYSRKGVLSSDRSLQLDYMKLELLVVAHQHVAVNTFPGLVHTAREAMEARSTESQCPIRKEGAA